EELLGALVDEAEPRLEVHDRLALDAEAEGAGLDDPGMDRARRDLEEAVALAAAQGKRLARVSEVRARHDVTAQRVISVGPVLMERETPQIRMPPGGPSHNARG